MTQETLSALLDGELEAGDLDRVLAEMERSPGLKAQFSRMLLAREARHSRIRRPDPGFSDRILAALDEQSEAPAGSNVVRFPGRWAQAWRPALGLALAAGLGAVAVLVLRPADVAAPQGLAATVASAESVPHPVVERQWAQLEPQEAERLNAYLIAYSQSRAQQGVGGTLGYARYAAYTAEHRPQRLEGPKAVPTANRQTVR